MKCKGKGKAGMAILGLAGAMAFSSAALAQDAGFYIGGAFGQAQIDGTCSGAPAGVTCDDKDSAWRIFGGYQLNRNFALEIGYANLGEAKASGFGITATQEVSAFDVVAVGSIPVADAFSVYGKLGFYSGQAETRNNFGVVSDDSGGGVTFGFGVRYDFTRNLGVRAEWQRYAEVGDDIDVNLVTLGVLFRF